MYTIDEFNLTIYAIQHNATGRVYIGITENVGNRIDHHLGELKRGKHTNLLMQKDCTEYGFGYSVFILETAVSPKDRWKERYYIELLHTDDTDIGYNSNDPRFKTHNRWRFVDGFPKMNTKGDVNEV